MIKKCFFFLFIIFFSLNIACPVYAINEPNIMAQAAIAIDFETGKVFYAKNEHKRMFPASMTKILTVIVALEYLDNDGYITVGQEINLIPLGSSIAGHKVGETISVLNAMRLLILRSGSDTAATVALATAKKYTGEKEMSYVNAEKIFSELMNAKAIEIGALNSNFTNPHGLHSPNHYTSAYDMALISQYAMNNEVFRQISSELSFVGNGAGENPNPEFKTQEYEWYTRNELLISTKYSYPHAIGIKTGFTDEAGYCLAGAAKKKDKMVITVVFDLPDEASRYEDTIALFDYSFDNFNYETIQLSDVIIDDVLIDNHKLGESPILELKTKSEFGDIFSKEQLSQIQKDIKYVNALIAENKIEGDKTLRLSAPIEEGSVVAHITYTMDKVVIFEDELLATRKVDERTFKTDTDYYIETFKNLAFSRIAIPFWIAGFIILFLIIRLFIFLGNRKRKNYYRIRRRY